MKPKLLASSVLCFCVAGLAPELAHAQSAPAPSPAAPGASVEKPAAQPAAPAAGASPSPAAVEEAKQRFDRGLDLYSEGVYPLALIEFTRAYELVPNYRVLYNIGQVGIQLGQYANARRALEEYLQKGGDTIPADRRASVAKDLGMLEQRTAFLEITVNVAGAEVLVDDGVVGKTPLGPALLVDAGVHRIVVRRPGYLQRNSEVTLAGGDRRALPLTLDPQPTEKATIVVQREAQSGSTLVVAGWATTGALAAGAIITGILGAGKASDLKHLKTADPRNYDDYGSKVDSTKSSASSLLLASDVCSGAALIVGGLSLWLTLSPDEKPSEATPDKRSGQARQPFQVGYQENQIELRGSF